MSKFIFKGVCFMTLDSLFDGIRSIGRKYQVWLTAEKLNNLEYECFRVNRKDNVVLASNGVEVELSIKEGLESNCATPCAKLERVSEMYSGTQIKRRDFYLSPEGGKIVIL